MPDTPDLRARFLADIERNPHVRAILARWERLALPDGWLVAGCLFQTVWNLHAGRDPAASIKDYDFFYFDESDLSKEGERAVQARVERELGDLGVELEAKNQARVHLWYQDRFGHPYPRLRDARDGIDRFLVLGTCVAVRPGELYAPYGLEMLYEGVLAPNPLTDHRALFEAKAQSYRARWPWLIVDGGVASRTHPTGETAGVAVANPAYRGRLRRQRLVGWVRRRRPQRFRRVGSRQRPHRAYRANCSNTSPPPICPPLSITTNPSSAASS